MWRAFKVTKLTKRMRLIAEKVDGDKAYEINEAVALLGDLSKTKFKESYDISINLGVDPRKSDQVVRGATTLPHGTGKVVRIAVFAQGENADKATAAGADLVGFDDLAEEVKAGKMDFDVVIATPDAMRIVGQLGKVLGPRGLMPNPKTGTVTPDVETAVKNAKAGQVQFRTDKAGIIHGSVGQVGFEPLQVRENVEALMADLRKAKPASAKGVYLKKVTLSTTMGPGVSIDQASLQSV
jgi:large subunit ribosomal protein L1